MARTSSTCDHFDLYLTPVTLTFNLPEKMFQMALRILKDNNCAKLFWNPCINVHVMARTSSIYDHFNLYLTPVTLTFNLPEKMFQMALLILEDNNCAKLFWNPWINVQVMAQKAQYMTILTFIWPLWPWPSTYLKKNVSTGTSPPRGHQLCRIILKSMHKCTSYGQNKLNTWIWPFWSLFDPCDLDLQPN